jgi:hypothetical protein
MTDAFMGVIITNISRPMLIKNFLQKLPAIGRFQLVENVTLPIKL